VDEFIRVAMAYPEIAFQFTNNGSDIFKLEKGKLKQRIIALLGNNVSTKLVPVEEPTDFVQISGFVATPDVSSKTRGNQFFFVNNRFIKSPYLNHAVSQAYRELIGKDEFPLFVLFIDIEPKRIDINVHPTKQEIKFEDDRIIYSFVSAAVKHALSKYSIAPSLDFSLDASIENLTAVTQPFSRQTEEHTKGDFLFQSFTEKGQAHFLNKKEDVRNWKDLYKIQEEFKGQQSTQIQQIPSLLDNSAEKEHEQQVFKEEFQPSFMQLNAAYIIASAKSGFLLIDQHLAHQRILYERFENAVSAPISIQKCLIPQTIELPPADALVLQGILKELFVLGYEIEEFGKHTFILQGIPGDVKQGNETASIEKIVEAYKHASTELRLDKRERLIRTLAMQRAIHHGKKLSEQEMQQLMQDLFRCEQPQLSPIGKKIFVKLSFQHIETLINNA
jgi:DNA mismatch repair protein MutL